MARPVNPETHDDDREDGGTDSFDRLLEKLTEKKDSGLDMNMLLKMREDERRDRERERERREAKENRQFMITTVLGLLAPVLPTLVEKIFGEKKNEMMDHYKDLITKFLTNDSKSNSVKDMVDTVMAVNKSALDSAVQQIKSIGDLKEEILKDQIDKMREESASNSGGNDTNVVSVMKEAANLVRATGFKLGGNKEAAPATAPAAPAGNETKAITGGNPAPAATKPPPMVVLVKALRGLHANQANMTPLQRAKLRTTLATVCLEDEELSKAIVDANQDKLMTLGTPVFTADQELMAWITADGVQEWLATYLEKQLAPLLDEAINGEQYAAEKDQDDASDDEKSGGSEPAG